jgi:hypothetical protein
MPGGYELHRQVWQEAKFAQQSSSWWRGFLPSPKDEEQFRWDGWLSRLEGAQRAVHAAPSVSDQTWEELRQQMQSLAAAYYRAGRPPLRLIPPAVEVSQRFLLASPVRTSKKADPLIAIPNDPISRSLFTALRDPKCFQVDEELAIVRCNISTSEPHRQGVLSISLPATASGLGDHLAATWLAILSLLLPKLQRDETHLTAPIALSSKILLEQL